MVGTRKTGPEVLQLVRAAFNPLCQLFRQLYSFIGVVLTPNSFEVQLGEPWQLWLLLPSHSCHAMAAKNNMPCYVYLAFWTYSCLFPLAMRQNTWYFLVYLVSWRNQIQNKITRKKGGFGSSRYIYICILYQQVYRGPISQFMGLVHHATQL